jgi:NmrA-like family
VTALTRAESKGKLPDGVKTVQVDFDNDDSLVSALKGQQFLVITLGVRVPADLHSRIVKAAAKAGVKYIMPNVYGGDFLNESLAKEDLFGEGSLKKCEEIEQEGLPWIAMACGFWYEWSLALGEPWFGFDIKKRTVTFFDDGTTVINSSTWGQCGRALAALLSLPESGASPSLADWKNKILYFSSFRVSQRDMLDSLHRVLGTTDKDWEITKQPSDERYKSGLETMQKGDITGFARAMYSRVFFPSGDGDFETKRGGLDNDKLGLSNENLDVSTKRAVDMVESGWNPFG